MLQDVFAKQFQRVRAVNSHGLRVFGGVVLALFFLLFLVLPLWTVAVRGFDLAILYEIIRNPIYVQGLLNSFGIAVVTTAMVFLIAIPMAVVFDRYEFPCRSLVNALVLLPMVLPPFVGALGFRQIFGQYGVLNAVLTDMGFCRTLEQAPDWLGNGGFWVVCLIEALHLYPVLYLNVVAALANIDPGMEEAAENLGAGFGMRFRRVVLPLMMPGVFAGGSIVFIWSFTELGTPLMLGFTRVTTVQVFNGITELESNPTPYALVLILLLVSAAIYVFSRIVLGRDASAMATKGLTGRIRKPLRGIFGAAPWGLYGIVAFLSLLPHIAIVLISIARIWYRTILPGGYTTEHYARALTQEYVIPGIMNSLDYSFFATLVCLAAGLLVAILVCRWKMRIAPVFDILAMLPLAVPGIVMAFGYLSMTTRYDWIRAWLDPVENPSLLLVLAYAMRRLPYVTRAAVSALQQTPEDLELAARNLGAGGFMTLRRITVPLIAANLVVGGLFAFSFSMLEVSDSLILAQKSRFYPITRAIFELSEILGPGPSLACAFGVWAMCFLAATLFAANLLLGKKLGSLFRF